VISAYADDRIAELVSAAVSRLEARLEAAMPFAAPHIRQWMRELVAGRSPSVYFLHPLAWPMVALPYWAEQLWNEGQHTDMLQGNLAYSCIAIYYYIRLLDDIQDRDSNAQPHLLPTAAFFHNEWHSTFQRYFKGDHPFWDDQQRYWYETNDWVLEGGMRADVPLADYEARLGRKTHAAKIPLCVVGYLYGQREALEAWWPCYDRFSVWHQYTNDLLDWHNDAQDGRSSVVLTEANAQRGDEALVLWMERVGWAAGVERWETWGEQVRGLAAELQCAPLCNYLEARTQIVRQRLTENAALLVKYARLAKAFKLTE
jgi:hypothetical protein